MSNSDRYTLETPENVEVEFELAGLGSRFCAMLIDGLVMFVLLMGFALLLTVLDFAWMKMLPGSGLAPRHWADWLAAAVMVLLWAFLLNGYFIFFELVMRGQTPGKRAMKIRVLRDDGTPATPGEILLRNILRLVDFLPAGYAVGAIVMFCSPLSKRLGDLAAGTIVVKEGQLDYRARADKTNPLNPTTAAAANWELTPEERRLVAGFLQRRSELLPAARSALAERIARPLHEKYGGLGADTEDYLERLLKGRHYET